MQGKLADWVSTFWIFQFLALFADPRVEAFASSTFGNPIVNQLYCPRTRLFVEPRNSKKSTFLPPQPPLAAMSNTTTLAENDALSHLMETAINLQSAKWDSIRLLEKEQLSTLDSSTLHNINSIVFVLEHSEKEADRTLKLQQYILAILSQSDQVDPSKLQSVVAETLESKKCILSLAPTDQLVHLCGFESGCIPPLGLLPSPMMTFVDESLLHLPQETAFLVGGGGAPSQSTLLPLRTLLDFLPKLHTASFRRKTISQTMTSTSQSPMQVLEENHFRPFFCVEPPDKELALSVLDGSENNVLSPESFSIVGRVSGVRQIARRLVFADFAPPPHRYHNGEEQYIDDHPWTNPRTKEDMAVQLVLGKTILENLGEEHGEAVLRSLKKGQLILVRGMTNVDKVDSLINWTSKRSLDVRVSEFQVLETLRAESDGSFFRQQQQSRRTKKLRGNNLSKTISPSAVDMDFLRMSDIYKDATHESAATVVDNLQALETMHEVICGWLNSHPRKSGLVGIDCEWKPSFLADPNEVQPVLLMQICFHPIQQIYLLDLQTLLRPVLQQDTQTNALEDATSKVIALLFTSERLIKTGFKVMNDFQRLAASYPHISSLQVVETVLELSRTGVRVLQLTKQARSTKATSSLSKMAEFFLKKTLNKEQQVSNWSVRPMTSAQLDYASLDAAITPHLIEHILDLVNGTIDPSPTLGRWDNDTAFADALKSWKFIVLNQKENSTAIQRLNAKRVVGPSFIVSQSWISGCEMPKEPEVPDDSNEAYTDAYGITRVPSLTISIPDESEGCVVDEMIGTRISKSKDGCLSQLLTANPLLQSPGHKLDFPQRSGYVEFENGVALFVTMPLRAGQLRKYPNEWIEDGSMLSWFVHDDEWGGGDSRLAKKMVCTSDQPGPAVMLFVRRGKEPFLCCGRCHVDTLGFGGERTIGNIVMLRLVLRDWDEVRFIPEFQQLL